MLETSARAAVCALLALVGCADEPSFQLDWRITLDPTVTEPDDAPELVSVKQCSEVGVEKVRLEVWRPDVVATPVLTREYPCFPGPFDDADPIDGPTLDPGEYELELIGLRRNGGEWVCPGVGTDEDGNPIEIDCVRGSGSVTVREGELPQVRFVIPAPVECDDGVDNDRDGRVDGSDPACQLGEAQENFDSGLTLFQLSVGFLANDLIEPRHVGIAVTDGFVASIDGEVFAAIDPLTAVGLAPWSFGLLDVRLDAGTHTFELVAQDADAIAVTEPLAFDFTVDAENGAFVIHQFEFGSADFLAPIIDSIELDWGLDSPGAGPCVSKSELLVLDDVRVRIVAGGGTPLSADQITVGGAAPLTVDPDGWGVFACDAGAHIATDLLTWTEAGYTAEFEGRVGGTACFATGPERTRPGNPNAQTILAARVVDDRGVPAPGCEECLVTADCLDLANLVCIAGVCVPE